MNCLQSSGWAKEKPEFDLVHVLYLHATAHWCELSKKARQERTKVETSQQIVFVGSVFLPLACYHLFCCVCDDLVYMP